MSTTTLLIILFVAATVALAVIPFVHKWWTNRPGYQPRRQLYRPPSGQPPSPAASATAPDGDPASAPGATPPDGDPASAPGATAPKPANKFRSGLAKARSGIGHGLSAIGRRKVDEDTWNQLTDALILADVGVTTATETVNQLRAEAASAGITQGADLLAALASQMRSALHSHDRSLRTEPTSAAAQPEPTTSDPAEPASDDQPEPTSPTPVWLFVGVNGVGKTTSIGKVGHRFHQDGRKVVFAAADTFRAAATEQLGAWAERSDGYLVSGSVGADPGSVIHDAVNAASARGYDIVLADTAGRLQNKTNLMSELAKIRRVADKPPGCVTEVLLVIDATTGQNGLSQAQSFTEAAEVTGVVLTKLDGSAKGGIVFAIEAQFGLPVKLVGLGEDASDLVEFDPDAFVDELLADAIVSQPN